MWISDDGTKSVLHVGPDGRLRWALGNGPALTEDRFRAIRDMELLSPVTVAVLDPQAKRLTIIDKNGAVAQTVSVAGLSHAEQFVPMKDGGYTVVTERADSPLTYLAANGAVIGRAAIPWRRFATLHPLASQNHTIADVGSGRWVLGLSAGEGFFSYADRDLRSAATYVERILAPSITPTQSGDGRRSTFPLVPFSATALALAGDTLFALFSGRSPQRGRLLDAYLITTGKYLFSYLLPVKARDIAWFDRQLYVLLDADRPVVLIVRPATAQHQ